MTNMLNVSRETLHNCETNAENQRENVREMSLNEYQQRAARTINKSLTLAGIREHALHEIVAEVGEIHSLYQKEMQGHPFDLEKLKKEIGDLLWGIMELCTSYGWTAEEIAVKNIEKLWNRYPDGFSEERSVHREGTED